MNRIIIAIAFLASLSYAGPPFLTDDPEPVEYRHWEAYIFGSGDITPGEYSVNAPALEMNYGILHDMQLHAVVPVTTIGGNSPMAGGLGTTEIGIKYRFIHETNGTPQIGIFPMAELPTGNADRGLGTGQTWFRLPLWLQKSWGQWTTYGGGGAAINFAPGQLDYPFGGWLLQRTFGKQLMLGGEIFAQGRDIDVDKGFTALNFGGQINSGEHFSLLFSAGHTVAGDEHAFWYLGLYWTW